MERHGRGYKDSDADKTTGLGLLFCYRPKERAAKLADKENARINPLGVNQ